MNDLDRISRWRLSLAASAAVLSWACTAVINGENDGSSPLGNTGGSAGATNGDGSGNATSGPLPNDREQVAAACQAKRGVVDSGRTPLRRLTRSEIDNSVRDVLQIDAGAATSVTPDEKMGPFYSNAVAPVDLLAVQQYSELAARVAQSAAASMQTVAGCNLDGDAACPERLITNLGRKLYRRPLEADERAGLLGLYETGKAAGGAAGGFRTVLEALLQSPFFLYHDDTYVSADGGSRHPSSKPLPLDPYVLAARLSFFLLGTTPDDSLLEAAAQRALTTPAQLTAQAERLVNDDRAASTLGVFHRQWLGVGNLKSVDRSSPLFSPTLVDAAYAETQAFADYVVRKGDGKLSTLLTSNLTFGSDALLPVYGVTPPANRPAGAPLPLDPNQRAGILTQAAFLMGHAHTDQTSPVHRGILVRENILCGTITPPPPNIVVVLPPVTETKSTRERFLEHEANPVCGACHKDIDPLGLGFENYDQVGAYRTIDGLGPVDASGAFTNVREDLAGNFVGAVQMAQALAKSSEVADCFSRQWFRFALGRIESSADACTVSGLQEGFATSSGNIRQLLTQIVASEAFRYVRSTGGNQ